MASWIRAIEDRLSLFIGNLISTYLGAFLIDFQAHDFKFRFSGDIEVAHVSVSPNAMTFLEGMLPWNFQSLTADAIHLHIPIFNLLEDGVSLKLGRISAKFEADDYSSGRMKKRPDEAFKPVLKVLPPMPNDLPPNADEIPTSVFWRICYTIIGKIQITLNNIYLNISDHVTNPMHPYNASLHLAQAGLSGCEINGATIEANSTIYKPTLHFSLSIIQVKAYLEVTENPEAKSDSNLLIHHEHTITTIAGIRLGTTADHEEVGLGKVPAPFLILKVKMQQAKLAVADEHMAFIWDILNRVFWWMRYYAVQWLRPMGRVSDGPVRWWQFPRNVLIEELNAYLGLLRCATWSTVVLAAQRRRRYIRLYRKYLSKNRNLTAEECIELQQLDLGLKEDCLIRYRAVAEYGTVNKLSLVARIKAWISSIWLQPNHRRSVSQSINSSQQSTAQQIYDWENVSSSSVDDEEATFKEPSSMSPESSVEFIVYADQLQLCLSKRANPCKIVDISLIDVEVGFKTRSDPLRMSAILSVADISSCNDPSTLRIVTTDTRTDPDSFLRFSWDVEYLIHCTSMSIGAAISQSTISVPSVFINNLVQWLFPKDFVQAPATPFSLIPPDLFAEEISEVQRQGLVNDVVIPFRLSVAADLGPFLVIAHIGNKNGPFIHFGVGKVITICNKAKEETVDQHRFPEFHHHLQPTARSSYDYFFVSINCLTISYVDVHAANMIGLHEQPVQCLTLLQPQTSEINDNVELCPPLGATGSIEAAILLRTSIEMGSPFVLGEVGLPPIKMSVSSPFYRILFQIMDAFMPSSPGQALKDDVDDNMSTVAEPVFKSTETVIEEREIEVSPFPLTTGYEGSRFLISVPSIEIALVDQFAEKPSSVLRIRATGLRVHAVVKQDASLKSSLAIQTESWYMNHTAQSWEPLIEPWILSIKYIFDGVGSHDLNIEGDTRPLNITCSSALAETLIHAAQTFNILSSPKQVWTSNDIVINDTGMSVHVISSILDIDTIIDNGKDIFLPSQFNPVRRRQVPELFVKLSDGSSLLCVQYHQTGFFDNGKIAATVTKRFGYVTIRIHSLTTFENLSGHSLDIAFESADKGNFFQITTLKRGATVFVPVQIVDHGRVMVRLTGRNVGFSSPIELMPIHLMSPGTFDLLLNPEPNDSNPVTAALRTESAIFALQLNRPLHILGHQNMSGKQLRISLTPVLVIENLLYSLCNVNLFGADGQTVEVQNLQCGNRIECFMNSLDIAISVSLPGGMFSERISISNRTSSGTVFKPGEVRRLPIGVPESLNGKEAKIYSNHLSCETEYQHGGCPIARLFSQFWIVNHTPKSITFNNNNVVQSYPRHSVQGVPLLMAGCEDMVNGKVFLGGADSKESEELPLCKLEAGTSVQLRQNDGTEYELRVKICRAAGRFQRTKIVTILPQLVIVNCLSLPIFLRQNAHHGTVKVEAKGRLLDYMLPEPDKPKLMRISFDPNIPGGWSGLLTFSILGHISLSVPRTVDGVQSSNIVECIVKQRDNLVYAVFRYGDMQFPPCQIDNKTRFSFEVSQIGLEAWNPVPPFSSFPFCWLEPLAPLGVDARFDGSPDTCQRFHMEETYDTDAATEWRTGKGRLLVEAVQNESPTKILRITELDFMQDQPSLISSDSLTALIDKSRSMLESCIKFAEKQYNKDVNLAESLRTRPSKLFINVEIDNDIVEAWDLPKMDANGLCDPFIEIIAGDSKDATPVCMKERNPHFHYSTVVQIRDGISSIMFRVMDYNVVKNHNIGAFSIPLSSLADELPQDSWFPIYKIRDKEISTEKQSGLVRVVLHWVRSSDVLKTLLKANMDTSVQKFQLHLQNLTTEKERILAESRRDRSSVTKTTRESIHRLLLKRRSTIAQVLPHFSRSSKQRIVSGKFKIGIISAKNCLAMDAGNTSDAYCKVSYGSQHFQTKVIKKSLNPDWDESFVFEYERLSSNHGFVLRIAVFDQDQASEDDFMGECTIVINDYIDLPIKQLSQEWHPILSMNKYADDLFRSELGESAITRGDILIQFEWVDLSIQTYCFEVGLKLTVPALGISVVDSGFQRELMYLSLLQFEADFLINNNWKDYALSLSTENFQIDNPDVKSCGGDTTQMVLIGAVRKAENPPQPMFQLVVQSEYLSELFDYFPYVNLLILDMSLTANTRWLSNMLWFIQHLMDLAFAGTQEARPPPLPIAALPVVGQDSGKKVFFGMMIMSPISLTVSFWKGIDSPVERYTDYDWILRLASSIALDSAQVRLNALGLSNHVSSYEDLFNLVLSHYIKNGASAAFNILGSSDVLGNPVQLVSGLGSGVKDFFFEPAAGLALGPAAFGRGLMKGSAALLSGTVGGVLNSASKVTGNLGNLAAAITMDEDYKAKTKIQQMQWNAVDGTGMSAMKAGGTAFGRGILSGVTGVFVAPIKGAQQDGMKGFMVGVGKGLVGVVTKPISGTLQLASAAAGGVRNAASTYNKNNHRRPMIVRFPRHFYGMHRRIKPYCPSTSKGKYILDVIHRSKYKKDDFVDILDLPDSRSLILSSKRLLLASFDASEAINHTLIINEEWMAPLKGLIIKFKEDIMILLHGTNRFEVNLSQVPTAFSEKFFNKITELITLQESDEQNYWALTESGDIQGVWPCSPLSDQKVPDDFLTNATSADDEQSITADGDVQQVTDPQTIETLEFDLQRLKMHLSSAAHTGTTLEVLIHSATALVMRIKLRVYCKVFLQGKPSAMIMTHQSSLNQDPDRHEHDQNFASVCQSQTLESRDPVWEFACHFPVKDWNSVECVIKVFGKRIGRDKLIGEAVFGLDGIALDQKKKFVLKLTKSKKGMPIQARGTVAVSVKLFNPHIVNLSTQVDITKHKIFKMLARKTMNAQKFLEQIGDVENDSAIQSDAEQSDIQLYTDEDLFDEQRLTVDDIGLVEDSLIRQYHTVHSKDYLREASLCDLDAMVQFEIIMARNFAAWTRKKAPPLRATISTASRVFKSAYIESWEPKWEFRFVMPMPRSPTAISIRIKKKLFIGESSVAKLDIGFKSLVEKASVDEGAWIKLNAKRREHNSSAEFGCELLLRIQIKSQVLEDLLIAETAIEEELQFQPAAPKREYPCFCE